MQHYFSSEGGAFKCGIHCEGCILRDLPTPQRHKKILEALQSRRCFFHRDSPGPALADDRGLASCCSTSCLIVAWLQGPEMECFEAACKKAYKGMYRQRSGCC